MSSVALQHFEKDLRRADRRYPVDAELHYEFRRQGVVRKGLGRTVNTSSSGILFEAAHALPAGTEIELRIAWPARFQNVSGLKLFVVGRIVRTHGLSTAVRILKFEFRAQGIGS
jgi:hypothetical protein